MNTFTLTIVRVLLLATLIRFASFLCFGSSGQNKAALSSILVWFSFRPDDYLVALLVVALLVGCCC